MKKHVLALVSLVMAAVMVFAGCQGSAPAEPETADEPEAPVEEAQDSAETPEEEQEVYLLAAASLTDVLNDLIEEFEAENPGYKIIPTYAASGALQSQIEEGAPADIFFSAAQKQMDELEEQGLVNVDSRLSLLENKVVLIVPEDSTLDLQAMEDLAEAKVETIGLGEFESVPVGQYSKEIFENLDILDEVLPKAVFGSDVRTVLTWVETGEVDAGLVYSTDAAMADVKIITDAPAGSVKPVIYPVAQLENSENTDAVAKFLEFITTDAAMDKFISYGFAGAEQ